LYYFLKYLAWVLVFLFMRYQRVGLKNVPARGPLLVVSNHLSVSDPVLIGIGTGRRIVFLSKEELFNNMFNSYFVTSFGAIPVYRGRFNREALVRTKSILDSGGVIGMFPEGHRSRTGTLNQAQPGSALIAVHNHVPILPIGIAGSETIKGLGWIWHRPNVVMRIGEPFFLPAEEDKLNSLKLDRYSDLIMNKIGELLPEKYRGVYAPKDITDAGQHR
jgi:1-acyl-sn-glycerol-3-phosphate acyltransferase